MPQKQSIHQWIEKHAEGTATYKMTKVLPFGKREQNFARHRGKAPVNPHFPPLFSKVDFQKRHFAFHGGLPPFFTHFYEHSFRALRYVYIFSALIPVLARPHVCRIHTARTNLACILFTNWE